MAMEVETERKKQEERFEKMMEPKKNIVFTKVNDISPETIFVKKTQSESTMNYKSTEIMIYGKETYDYGTYDYSKNEFTKNIYKHWIVLFEDKKFLHYVYQVHPRKNSPFNSEKIKNKYEGKIKHGNIYSAKDNTPSRGLHVNISFRALEILENHDRKDLL